MGELCEPKFMIENYLYRKIKQLIIIKGISIEKNSTLTYFKTKFLDFAKGKNL